MKKKSKDDLQKWGKKSEQLFLSGWIGRKFTAELAVLTRSRREKKKINDHCFTVQLF